MLTAAQLKQITTEARPIIERMLEDAERLAGLRDVVSAAGGDWGQLKALIKAQIKDEQDEAGEGKHVRKILDKADYATAYADMLGLSAFAKMNEENFFEDDIPHDADGVVLENEIPGNGAGTAEAEDEVALYAAASAETNSPAVSTSGWESSSAGTEGEADRQPISEPADRLAADADSDGSTAAMAPVATNTNEALKKRWTFNDPAHRDCLNPGMCGGFSNLKLCQRCREASAMGQVA